MTTRPDWLDPRAYPFEAHHLDLPGGRMHYVDEGEGPPVVMVHGNPTWSFLYRHLIQRLAPRYRCIAPDHLGFGLSEKPSGRSIRPQEHAQNLGTLIDSLGLEGITLVVQDWGGPIGLSFAIERPERVARLVILNTWLWPVDDDWYYRAFSGFMGGPVGAFLIRRLNFFARVVMPMAYGDRKRLTPEIHRHYLRPLGSAEERLQCLTLPREIIASTGWLRSLWNRREVLRERPALIVWGMKDIGFREKELGVWTGALPAAEVVRLTRVGHYVQEEAPEELGEAVDRFLAAG
ncbi:MAG: alpha/beta fold hydrolase [bacterium]